MADKGYQLPIYQGAQQGNFDQWLRKWTLTINKTAGTGSQTSLLMTNDTNTGNASLGELRIKFEIRQGDRVTPNTGVITIYNLSDETAMSVIKEYSQVSLQAGYLSGHYGIIFEGTIKQFKKGRESAIDSYLVLYCADGDVAHNHGIMNAVLPAGWDLQDMQDSLVKKQTEYGPTRGNIAKQQGGVKLPRPATQYGMGVDEIESYTATTRKTWSVQNGKIVVQPLTAYAPGDIVVINSGTGMISAPEVTQDGIQVTCLLNPSLFIKGRVQLDNRTFNQTFGPGGKELREGSAFPSSTKPVTPYATTAQDGIYCIVVIEHSGDTRGLEWYTRLTCWSIDGSSSASAAVQGQKEGAQA